VFTSFSLFLHTNSGANRFVDAGLALSIAASRTLHTLAVDDGSGCVGVSVFCTLAIWACVLRSREPEQKTVRHEFSLGCRSSARWRSVSARVGRCNRIPIG